MGDTREDYLAARTRLCDTLRAGVVGQPVEITADDAGALLRGYPPDRDLPRTWASFDASYVPFLRSALCDDDRWTEMGGITVTPLPEGGAVLAATDGHILALAYDASAKASEGGVQVVMPDGAVRACEPQPPLSYADQGSVFFADLPVWAHPGRVLCAGASMLVTPLEQPPDPGRHPEDGVMLWASMVETSGHWVHGQDARRIDPVAWWRAVELSRSGSRSVPLFLNAETLDRAAQAMMAVPDVLFWQASQIGSQSVLLLPTAPMDAPEAPRRDLAILFTLGDRLLSVEPEAWINFKPSDACNG